ncbi:MAG: hypothetical protein ACFE0Q_12175 [Anaerolineae bacterium]
MPTPFTHLHISLRLLDDALMPSVIRAYLGAHRSDFLLGGVVADQRPESGARSDTHFYEYTRPMPDHPWREMLRQHPTLQEPASDAHHVFLSGYVAHLAADEYWSRHMLKPHFAEADWGTDIRGRFYLLHLLLITMDERDQSRLPEYIGQTMRESYPQNWLPFLSDEKICDWRDFIAYQLEEDDSQTLTIFGGRIDTKPEEVRALLDDSAYMQRELWDHVSQQLLSEIETKLYAFAREQLLVYLNEFRYP